jgi:hypothetical protein
MRRAWAGMAVAACAALLVSLLAASTATAGFKHGRYAGTTDQGTEISFRATNAGVMRFSYSVTIQCDDGWTREFTTGQSAKAPISKNGRFTAEFVTPDDSVTSVVDGRLKRRKARGSIETAGTVEGGWECHGSVAWTAKRQ